MNEVRKQENETNVDIPERFKMTDLGLLPEEWEVTHFENVVEEIISGDWGHDKPAHGLLPCRVLRGTDFVHAAGNDISKVPIRYVRFSSVERRRLRVGDILVELSGGSKDQPTGRTLLVTDSLLRISDLLLLFSNFVKCIRLSSRCIPEYITFYWHYLYESGVTRIYEKRTTGIRNFKLSDFLANEMLPLPPLPEQRAIAHVLRTVQRAKEATERVIQATRELKKSLMRHLFTYGPVEVGEIQNVPLKETEIGLVPEHWKIKILGDVIAQAQYGLSQRGSAHHGKYPILRMNNLHDGTINIRDLQYVDLDKELFLKFRLNKGDLLFNRTNSHELVGKTALFNLSGDYVFASYLIRIVPDASKLTPEFLNYYLNTESTQARLKSLASRGVSQSNISATKLKSFKIPIPPLSEQWKISRILQVIDKKLQAEEARRQAMESLFKTLLHNLMTGKIRVKDVVLPNVREKEGNFTH